MISIFYYYQRRGEGRFFSPPTATKYRYISAQESLETDQRDAPM